MARGAAQGELNTRLQPSGMALGSFGPSAQNSPDGRAPPAFAASSLAVRLPFSPEHLFGVEGNPEAARPGCLPSPYGQGWGLNHRDSTNEIEALSSVSW